MLIKFESKSSRVKGLSFHPKLPWILASLYNGTIQLWDYRLCTLLEKFEDHEGPVRAVSFHPDQPIFVSGGDDTNVKVWSYQQMKLLFTLKGHIDYIRTTFFHHESPWIASASDDNTIKIWNWQSRVCITTITGHSHYVMCAQFHMSLPLMVSCSLDQTIRLWDISGLKNKFFSPSNNSDSSSRLSSIEVLAPMDVLVKNIIEGHERGVNWVSFHPSQSFIISCSDDRVIKIWRFSETGVYEVNGLRGHYNNVCCALLSVQSDRIISVSEDKSIRIWDANKHSYLSTYRRDNDRFWALAVSPSSKLIAAGHDTGMILFKLHREKPAFDIFNNSILYLKDKFLKKFEPLTFKDSVVVELKKIHSRYQPKTLLYNPIENLILITYTTQTDAADGSFVEFCSVPSNLKPSDDISEVTRIQATSAVWVSRNRIVCVDKSELLIVRNIKNEVLNTLDYGKAKAVFYAGTGLVLAQMGDKISLIDVKDSNLLNTITFPRIRFVQWSHDFNRVALVSKNEILVCSKDLKILTRHTEAVTVKSCAFSADNSSVLLYTTPYHLKYLLVPWGDRGIIRTLDVVLYIVHSHDVNVSCLDRDAKPKVLRIDNSEYMFKLALLEGRHEEIVSIIRSSNLVGQALISFVRDRGLPEIALHFIKDDKTRFYLSLECMNLQLALELAKKLDGPEYWSKLAPEALKCGQIGIAEESYIRLGDAHSLSLLYVITGNTEKLKKLMKSDGNFDSKAISCLYLGDMKEFAMTLFSQKANSLGIAASLSYSISELIPESKGDFSTTETHTPFVSIPTPIRQINEPWPRLAASKNIFDIISEAKPSDINNMEFNDFGIGHQKADDLWNEDIDIDDSEQVIKNEEKPKNIEPNKSAWDADDDIEIEEDIESVVSIQMDHSVEPKPLFPSEYINCSLPVVQIMMGSFANAFKILGEKFGIADFSPLKDLFLSTYIYSKTTIPYSAASNQSILSYPSLVIDSQFKLPFSIENIRQMISQGYELTTAAQFVEAKTTFVETLHKISLLVISDKKQLSDVKTFVKICRDYITGLSMEIERRSIQNDQNRVTELAAYFAYCELQTSHSILVHKNAMVLLYKLKNFKSASVLAKRLLDLAPVAEISQQARKIVAACEKNGLNNEVTLNYDEFNPFEICCGSFTPIYHGDKKLLCSYCSSNYKLEYNNQACRICQIGKIGATCPGFKIEPTNFS